MSEIGMSNQEHAQALRKQRRGLELTLEEVSKATGISRSMLSGFETGIHGMSPEKFQILSAFYASRIGENPVYPEACSAIEMKDEPFPQKEKPGGIPNYLLASLSKHQIAGMIAESTEKGHYEIADSLMRYCRVKWPEEALESKVMKPEPTRPPATMPGPSLGGPLSPAQQTAALAALDKAGNRVDAPKSAPPAFPPKPKG